MYKSEQCFFRGVQYNDQVRPFQHNCSSSLALKYRWASASQSESPLSRSDPLLAWGHLDCEYGPCTPPCARQGGLWEQEGVLLIQWHFFSYGRSSHWLSSPAALLLLYCLQSDLLSWSQTSTQSQPTACRGDTSQTLPLPPSVPATVIVTHKAQPCHSVTLPAQDGLRLVHIGWGHRCWGTTLPSMQRGCWDL